MFEDYAALSRAGADIVASVVAAKPDAAVVVATGETPMGLYQELVRRREAETFDASGIRVFQLDEYAGLPEGDRRSLLDWTLRSFVVPLQIPLERVVRLPSDGDVSAGCATYDRAIEGAGGLDLAILGIGTNGHIGFNEPPSDRSAPTREVTLTPETVRANARYWGGGRPVARRAVTAGMETLLKARKTVLLACGLHKRGVVRRAMHGPVTAELPASFLQEAEDVTVLVDRTAWDGSRG